MPGKGKGGKKAQKGKKGKGKGNDTKDKGAKVKDAKSKESKSKELKVKETKNKDAKDKDAKDKDAIDKDAKRKGKDAKDKDAKYKVEKGKDVKGKDAKSKDAKDKDSKDKDAKNKDTKSKDTKDKDSKDKDAKNKDPKSKDAKDKDAKDKDAKDKDAKDKDAKDKDAKDKDGKDKDAKDKDAKDKDAKDKDAKDKDGKDKDGKDKDGKDKENKPDAKKDDKNKKRIDSFVDGKKKEENDEAKEKTENVEEKGKKSKSKGKKTIFKGLKESEKSEENQSDTKEQEEELVTKADICSETELVIMSPKASQTSGLNELLEEKCVGNESSSISVFKYGEGSSVKSLNSLIGNENEEFGPLEDQARKMSSRKSIKSDQSRGSIKVIEHFKQNELYNSSEKFNVIYPNERSILETRDDSHYLAKTDTVDKGDEQVMKDDLQTQAMNQNIDDIETFGRASVFQHDSQNEKVYQRNISEERENSLYPTELRAIFSNENKLNPTNSVMYQAGPGVRVESRLHSVESMSHPVKLSMYATQSTLNKVESRLHNNEPIEQPADPRLSLGKVMEIEPLATSSDASTTTSDITSSSNASSLENTGTTDEHTSDSVVPDDQSGALSVNRIRPDILDQSTMVESAAETSTDERDESLLSNSMEESTQTTSSDESRAGAQPDVPEAWGRLNKDEDQYFKRRRNSHKPLKNADTQKEIKRKTSDYQEPTSPYSYTPLQSDNDLTNKQTSHDNRANYPVAKWASLTFASPDDGESVSQTESLTDQKSSSSKKRGKKKSKRHQEAPVSKEAPSSTSFASSPVDKRNDHAIIAALEATQASSDNMTKATYDMRDAINKLSQLLNNMNLSIRNLATSNTNGKLSRDESRYEVRAAPTVQQNVTPTGYRYTETQYVEVKVVYIRIMDIDTLNQNFEAEIYIQARWAESQFAGLSEQQLGDIDFSKCWNPCLKIVNASGTIESERTSMLLQYEPDRVYPVLTYMWQVRGIFREHLELHHFPFDVQELSVVISSDLTMNEVELISDFFHPSHVNSRALQESQDWIAYQHIEFSRDFTALNLMSKTKHPILSASAHVKRRLGFYFWNVAIIVFLIIGLSFCVLAIEPTSTDRLGLLLTLFLTAVAFKLVVKTTLPTISYLTYLDIYIVFTLIYLALQAAVSALMINLAKYRDRSHILQYDEIAQSLLISLVILFHLVFIIYIQLTALRRRRQMKEKDREYLLSHVRKQGPFYPPTEKQTQTSISVEQKAGDGSMLR